MESIALGSSARTISRLGLGCWPLGGHAWGAVDDNESIRAVHRALDLGVNHFDTADVYGLGHSEQVLARALGPRTKDVLVATKYGVRWDAQGKTWRDISPAYLRTALENSLRRLQIDSVPLYYVHWPQDSVPLSEVMAELVRCRQAGKIQCIGLSNFSPRQLLEALTVAPVDALQIQFSLLDRQRLAELLPVTLQHRITVVTWGSLVRGLLTGKFDASSRFPPEDSRSRDVYFQGDNFVRNLTTADGLASVAGRLHVSPAQLALRWVLDTPGVGCALFGAKTAAQVEINVGALDWHLAAAEYQEIQAL